MVLIRQKKSWWILLIVSIGVMVPFMVPYLTFNPSNSRITVTSTIQFSVLIGHIILAFVALVTGFLQFIDRIRLKNPHVHRNIGKIYVAAVFASDLLAFILFFYADDFTKAMAFLTLAVLWLITTWKGLRKAINGRFEEHRIWMIRSFGITLVAVTARLIFPILLFTYALMNGFTLPGGMEHTIDAILRVNIWIGLVLNIVIVEWVFVKKWAPTIR